MEDHYVLPKGVILKFLLLALNNIVIGTFELSAENRTWSFKYADSFKNSSFKPLDEFPITDCSYGHNACVKWLAARLNADPTSTKGYSFAEQINKYSGLKREPLELHIIH